jgi:transposase InsO family protein
MIYMPYTTNPHMPRIRKEAVALVERGWSTRKVSRHTGFSQSVIVKWCARSDRRGYGNIPTHSSRPKHHPKQLSEELLWAIFQKRLTHKRCAEVVHQELLNEGLRVSLSSVKRTLDRMGLTKKRSPWKRYHPHVDRPKVERPGSLVQIDTIHTMQNEKKRMYTFVLIDVYSRWMYARSYQRMNARTTLSFVRAAERQASFRFSMLQSDHGPEFGKWFVEQIQKDHRYTRIGKPNDNAHVERVNRTLQEECLDNAVRTPEAFNRALRKYLPYYNNERLHMGISLRAPQELLNK